MKNFVRIVGGLVLLLSFLNVGAANYYVNNNSLIGDVYCTSVGDVGNNGLSASTPKLTLTALYNAYGPSGTNVLTSGDIIYVDAGTYIESERNLTIAVAGLKIIGAGMSSTIFDNNSNLHNFIRLRANNITLQDFYIREYANNTTIAQAIDITGGAYTGINITRVQVDNNGYTSGGAYPIEIQDGSSVTFTNGGGTCNDGWIQSGGIHIDDAGTVVNFHSYLFVGNMRSDGTNGVALRINNGTVNIYKSFFTNNVVDGGSESIIYQSAGTLKIYDTKFDENDYDYSFNEYGGLFLIEGGTLYMTRSRITNTNKIGSSFAYGGAVCVNGGTAQLDSCYFSSNEGDRGTDLHCKSGSIIAYNCTFGSTSSQVGTRGGTITLNTCGDPGVYTSGGSTTKTNTNNPTYLASPIVPSFSGTCASSVVISCTTTLSYTSSSFCSTGNTSPTVSPLGGTFSSTSGLNINSSTGVIDLSTSTTGTYTVSYFAAGCTATSNLSVISSTTPSVLISSSDLDDIICSGTSVTFTATPTNGGTGPTYQWKLNGTDITGAISSTYTTSSLVSGDIISVVLTSDASCLTTSTATSNTITITVNPNPTSNAGSALTAICQGGTSSAMGGTVGGGSTGGTWSGGSGTWTNANDPANATYTATTSESGSITLTLTTTGGSCGTITATKTITVNANVTPTFSAVSAICSGESLSALPTTSNNGITGTWSPALDNTATTTYTFTPTAGQCATTTTLTITVNPNITPSFTAVSAICSGESLSALPTTSNNGITGTWSPALDNTATTTYTFTPTSTSVPTCASQTTLKVEIFSSPILSTKITDIKCWGDANGSIEAIVSNGKAPFEYYWSVIPNDPQIITSNKFLNKQQSLDEVKGVGIYVKDANGCVSNQINNIEVKQPDPLVMNPSVDASIKMNCFAVKDGAITISPKGGVVPYTYSWTGNGVNAASKDQTGLTAGDYFVSIKDANNCNLSGIKITISSYPQITFEVDTIHPSCYDDFGKINVKNVKPSDAYKYKIDQENYKDSTIFRNLLSDNQYTITVKNTSNGCESSKKVPIGSVKERVLLSSSSDFTFNDMTCSNKNSSISFLNPKMGYTYSIDYFTTFNTTGKFENLLPGNYKVVVRTKDNCRDTSEIFVVKNVLYSTKPNTTQVKKQYCEGDKASSLVPALNSSYIWYDQQGMLLNTNDKLYDGIYYVGNIEPGKCESDRVEIDVDLSRMSLNLISKKAATCNKQDGEIIIQAVNGIGQIKYTWSNTDGQILGNNAKLVGVSDGTYIVEAEDAIGCKVISSPPISMTCTTPEIPQIVTPDNDGKNDTWKINYKSSYPRVKVQIYNRWGNLVYESQPYEDDWDGKPSVSQTLGKNELPTGTYYYVIDKQGDGTDLESGFVELIK